MSATLRTGRVFWLAVLVGTLTGVFSSGPAASEPRGGFRAAMDCATEPGSGRLVCTVELEPPAGHRLTWSDVLVVSAPPAATPLRSRVRGSGRPPRRIVLGFVLGSGAGGRIEVLARAVACPAKATDACLSLSKPLGFDVEAR